jgi:hypothetical protein
MSELNYTKCGDQVDAITQELFNETDNIVYFLNEEDKKTFNCYDIDSLKGMINNSPVFYDWDGPENSLAGANLNGQQYIKISSFGGMDFFVEKPDDLDIFDEYKLFYFQKLEERRIGSDTGRLGAVSAIHGRTMFIYKIQPLNIEILNYLGKNRNFSFFIGKYEEIELTNANYIKQLEIIKTNKKYKYVHLKGTVTDIKIPFLTGCYHLKRVRFFLHNLQNVGHEWMSGCENLEGIDFSGLSSLETVGNYWMNGCKKLERIDFTGLSSLKTVGNLWNEGCNNLESINFTGLNSLETVGDWWMKGCKNLERVDFKGLSRLKTVGDIWMLDCHNLKSIDFKGLSSLESVGDHWLYECNSLESIDFTELNNLKTVGHHWMSGCYSLENVNFRGLDSLETVGNNWINNCEKLENVNFTGLSSLKDVGHSWMSNCNKLKSVNIKITKQNIHQLRYAFEILKV